MSRYDDDDDEVTTTKQSTRRKYDDDDDIDAPPAKEEKSAPRTPAKTLKRGWGAADKVKDDTSSYASRLKATTTPVLIKFLEESPYVSFAQHFLRNREGQKTFVCLAKEDPKGCPLCNAGDRAAMRACFNVALIDEDGGEPTLKSLDASAAVMEMIKNYHNEPKTGPINKNYWAWSKASDKQTANMVLNMVKERDIPEDWGDAHAITSEEDADLRKRLYDASIVTLPTRKLLLDVAAEDLLAGD